MSNRAHEDDQVKIRWDIGTGYDFFISYAVLNEPKRFGIRSAWASGMRARLQAEDREILDTLLMAVGVPAEWIFSLPAPKSVDGCLASLSRIPKRERLSTLACHPDDEKHRSPTQQLFMNVAKKGTWSETDLEALRAGSKHRTSYLAASTGDEFKRVLEAWSCAEAFGERLLEALQNYHLVFFKEEEERIAPKLEQALKHAQERSKTLSTLPFLEEISQGIRYDDVPRIEELALVPSYWVSPFIQIHTLGINSRLWAFGARPADNSLVPGEPVPDALRSSLKALADPTRLRILRYLRQQPLTMGDLTKRLRLRMPTVIHHLSALRLAGLVSIHVETVTPLHDKDKSKGNRQRYGVRMEGLNATLSALKGFIESDGDGTTPEVNEEES